MTIPTLKPAIPFYRNLRAALILLCLPTLLQAAQIELDSDEKNKVTLNLSSQNYTGNITKKLTEALDYSRLDILLLDGNKLKGNEIDLVIQLIAKHNALKTINLCSTGLTKSGMEQLTLALFAIKHSERIVRIYLNDNFIWDQHSLQFIANGKEGVEACFALQDGESTHILLNKPSQAAIDQHPKKDSTKFLRKLFKKMF